MSTVTSRLPKLKKVPSLARKPWSFLAYIAGDNNLSDAGLEDIEEMCAVGSSGRIHAAVEIDTYGDHTGSIRYEISEPDATGAAHRLVIERLPEQNTGDPETLRHFLWWGLNRYPASKRLVVVWNHGAGFRSVRRDIAFDDYGSSLDMPEIEQAMKAAGISRNKRVAVLGFDACLMNMVEVVHHLKDYVVLVVGSQQTEPGDGWPYDKVLNAMKSATSPAVLAKSIVKAYIDDYEARGDMNVTQSAVDADKTEAAIAALSKLGTALARRFSALSADLRHIRSQVQSFEFADYVDVIHFADLLGQQVADPAIVGLSRTLSAKTQAAIVASGKYGPGVDNANGLSMWFPPDQRTYLNYRAKYLALNFARKYTGWIDFLDAFHA